MLSYFGKILILTGFLLVLIGIIFLLGSKTPFFGKLPGDIYIKRGSFSLFAPIGTSIVISIILSIIFYIISRFFR